MREWYKTIYLSPHLDDAALSCGGRISMETAAAHPVLNVSLMAGEPAADVQLSDFAKTLHARWDLARDAVRVRRAEDQVACQILGADYLHGQIPDCIYRMDPATGEPRYPSWQAVITTQHPADEAIVAQLTELLRQLPPADEIVVPLTAGAHVDHRLVRQAAEAVFGAAALSYYEDYPYVAKEGRVAAVLNSTPQQWQATQVKLAETAVHTRIEAIWAYASQRSSFFADRAEAEEKIRAYIAKVGGEQYWQQVDA